MALDSIIVGLLLFVVLVGFFIGCYKLNKKTPKPDIDVSHIECNGCKIGCGKSKGI